MAALQSWANKCPDEVQIITDPHKITIKRNGVDVARVRVERLSDKEHNGHRRE